MKLKKLKAGLLSQFLLLVFLSVSTCYGQEKISVYFSFGSSHLSKEEKSILDNFIFKNNFSELDSVQFIGMADSVGRIKANFRLSEKRAQTVANYLFAKLPVHLPMSISALGETEQSNPEESRRVDVLFYFKGKNGANEETTEIEEEKENFCFTRDNSLHSFCYIRTSQKKKKTTVIIETEILDLKQSKIYYVGRQDKNGEMIPRKVNWKLKRTGRFWWEKERLVYEMPQEDFNTYGFMFKSDPPCDSCSLNYFRENYRIEYKTQFVTDVFLMSNIQYKELFLRPNQIQIRIPKDYIVEGQPYSLIGRSYKGRYQIAHWDTKWGKKKQMYYFSNIKTDKGELPEIQRAIPYINCYYVKGQKKYNGPWHTCGTHWHNHWIFSLKEMYRATTVYSGLNYYEGEFQPYIGLGLSHNSKSWRGSLMAGTDHELSLYTTGSLALNFKPFWHNNKKITSAWLTPTHAVNPMTRLTHLYLGTELRHKRFGAGIDYTEQNIHFGMAYLNYRKSDKLLRFYLQGGVGYDFLKNVSGDFYPIAELGVSFQIFR